MKIKFVTKNLAPFRIDWLDEMAKYVDVTIFYINDTEKNINPQYLRRKPIRAKYRNIRRYKKFIDYREIFKEYSDLIVLDGYGFLSQVILICILKVLSKPYLISFDGGIIPDREFFIKYKLKQFLIKGAIAYLSTSIYTDKFIKHYAGEEISILRHNFSGVFNEEISSITSYEEKIKLRKKFGIAEKFVVIAIGQFIYRKGFDLLIKAAENISDDVLVMIVGGNNVEVYEDLINDKNTNKLKFINFCESDILREYYRASDCFVLPTRYDIWGLVICEAMSNGLSVITTDKCIAGLSLIQDDINGYIVNSENYKLIAEKINYLAKNSTLNHEMGEVNLNKIKEYSIENAVKNDIIQLDQLYKNM